MMNRTILQCIKNSAIKSPHKMAIACEKKKLTYGQYWRNICTAATFLKHSGVQKGEHIIVKAQQSADFLSICHAVQLCGAICVPIEKSCNANRLFELMQITNCSKYFADINTQKTQSFSMEQALNYEKCTQDWAMPNESDEAMVLFTTGTTGKSKGIVLSYFSEYAVAQNVLFGVSMSKTNTELIPMPMNHSYSLRRYFANMVNGSSVVIAQNVLFVKLLFNLIEKYNVTAMAMAPAAMNIILKLSGDKISEYNSQLHYLQFGGSPITQAEKENLIKLLPDVRLYNIYGSTEYGCACCLSFHTENNKPYCIGKPTKNSKVKIVDENFAEIENATSEKPGYLAWAGTMGMNRYFNDNSLTAQTVVGGYLKTNDLGYIDENGFVYMLGRADDVIMSGGNKISPVEVEEIALKFAGVTDCICKKEADTLLVYIPVLYIVAQKPLDIDSLNKHLMNYLEDFKIPRKIYFADEIPRTYNNKIDRNKEITATEENK